MLSEKEINQLFIQGKQDILTFMRAALAHETSLLASLQLSLNNGDLGIDPAFIRQRLIQENYDLLASLPERDPRLLRVMSLASGRLTQLKEFSAALSRIEGVQTESAGAFGEKLGKGRYLLNALERPCIKIREGSDGVLSLDGMGLPMMPDNLQISYK